MLQRFDPPSAPSTLWDTFQCGPCQVAAAAVWAALLLLIAAAAERREVDAVDVTVSAVAWRVPYFSDGPCPMSAEDENAARGLSR